MKLTFFLATLPSALSKLLFLTIFYTHKYLYVNKNISHSSLRVYMIIPISHFCGSSRGTPNIFIDGKLRMSCGRSQKIYILTAVNTVPSWSLSYISISCRELQLEPKGVFTARKQQQLWSYMYTSIKRRLSVKYATSFWDGFEDLC